MIQVGDRVMVHGSNKFGTLMFCGSTDFACGVWAGVALDDDSGKNDGSVNGVVYFKCKRNHGIFVQANKVAKVSEGRHRMNHHNVIERAFCA